MNIAPLIDHTALSPETSPQDVERLCTEAIGRGFASVCVPPCYVPLAKSLIRNSMVHTTTVIGFPFGYSTVASKDSEIRRAIADGADELDVVVNLAALKSGDWDYLSREIVTLLQPIRLHRKIIKVIIETGILIDEEIVKACRLYMRHKVDFIKTSTGYAREGATVAAVKLLRSELPSEIKIKASGGIRTFALAKELIEAGAARIGTSSGIIISDEQPHILQ